LETIFKYFNNWYCWNIHAVNILVYGITLSGDAKYLANNIGKIQVRINFKDTPRDIWNNVITIANKTFEDMYVVNIVIIANTGIKNMRLILFGSHSYLDISSDSIARQSPAKYNRQLVPFNTPISQISEDKNFYFNMVKFWVSLQKKFKTKHSLIKPHTQLLSTIKIYFP
jgi:hypothetical protein